MKTNYEITKLDIFQQTQIKQFYVGSNVLPKLSVLSIYVNFHQIYYYMLSFIIKDLNDKKIFVNTQFKCFHPKVWDLISNRVETKGSFLSY